MKYLKQNNIMPLLEVKGRRVGGATYQVPIDVRQKKNYIGSRWLTLFHVNVKNNGRSFSRNNTRQ